MRNWKAIAEKNANAYDSLDGALSVYKCKTLSEFEAALKQHVYPSAQDPSVVKVTDSIQGILTTWPLQFLSEEKNLSNSTAAMLVSTDMWV